MMTNSENPDKTVSHITGYILVMVLLSVSAALFPFNSYKKSVLLCLIYTLKKGLQISMTQFINKNISIANSTLMVLTQNLKHFDAMMVPFLNQHSVQMYRFNCLSKGDWTMFTLKRNHSKTASNITGYILVWILL